MGLVQITLVQAESVSGSDPEVYLGLAGVGSWLLRIVSFRKVGYINVCL